MNSRQRWENQGATLFSGKPCQIITSNSGLFFDLSGEVSHTETAWMLGESDRLPKEAKKLFQAIYEMNSRQRWENQGATLFSGKPCQIITSNSGLFFDLSGEVSHTETAWMLGESDRLHPA